jgi:hypothetical protein
VSKGTVQAPFKSLLLGCGLTNCNVTAVVKVSKLRDVVRRLWCWWGKIEQSWSSSSDLSKWNRMPLILLRHVLGYV